MSAVSFQAILAKALADYGEQIGVELDKHPFANELRGRDSPEEVLKLLEDKAKAFKVYRDGNRKLINWLTPVVQVIHTLSGVLGKAVPFQPAKAIFVGVDVLITAADGVSSSYDALVDLFECIGNFLKRLRIYTDIPLTPSMAEIIGQIMVELLSVFALATKQIKQGRFKKFAKKLLGEKEIEAVLQRLDRLTQEEGRMTAVQTLEVVHGLMNNVKVVMNDGKVSTDGIRKTLDTMQEMASDINKMRRDQLQKDSKSWLCPPDPSKNYNIGCQIHRDGTATWFFRGSTFAEWNEKGSLLWIYGKPGSGKSILLSWIIREINDMCKAGLASMAYFYFDFRESEKRHRRGLLSSLVFQLGAESDPCYQILSCLYSDHAGGNREPSEDALSQCLVEMLKVPGQPAMYIIIDALDECPNISGMPTPREQVLEFLTYLGQLKLPNVHICVSSRFEADIRNALEPLAPLRMSLHDEGGQKVDISSYINAIVQSDSRMQRWRKGDQQMVIDTLSDNADGMFRWVYCQLEILRRTLPAHLRRALKNMPKTLDETYERALLEIDEEMRQYAQRLFQCLAVSIRPLRVEELAEILAVQFDAGALPQFNPDWRFGDAEEAVLSVCSNLISVVDVGGSQVVQFSHFSVKEFLTSDRLSAAREDLSGYHIVPHSAHTIIAQASLSVLLQLDNHIDKDSIKNFPLSGYAAQYWVYHGQFENISSRVQVAMERLFNPDEPHFSAWVWIYDIDDPWRGSMPTTHPQRPQAAPLYYAVLCGFRSLIEHLVFTYPRDVDARGGYHESPLLVAFIKNDIGTASSLLQRGADANAQDRRDMSPLHHASQGGRVDILQLLLDHGADVNVRDWADITPLGWTSRAGEIEASRLLLQRGANVNSQNVLGESALHYAARCGHLNAVRLLIESGANIDLQTKRGSTPLYFASNEGYVKSAELLIQHGANVGSRDNSGCTPLHRASKMGHVQLAELLIQHGTPVNYHDNKGTTPMHLAACNGHLDIVKLLVGCGADPNIHDDNDETPLDLATDNEKLEVANFLSPLTTFLVEEVESTASSVSSSASSEVGCSSRHPNAVELPVPGVEDVELSKSQQPSIHTASENGQIDIVRSLLDHGSDVDERNASQRTALIVASRYGKLQVAKLLVERGADVNSRSPTGWTPLLHASRNGHLDVVWFLLDHGADLNACQRSQRSALELASFYGHLKIAKLLLERGANPSGRNSYGLTPKQQAIAGGYGKIAELLSQYGARA